MKLIASTVLFLVVISFFCIPVYSDSLILFPSPKAAAMGDAFGAVANDDSAIIINPAGMNMKTRYGANADYLYNMKQPEHRLDFSILDSVTSPVGVGIGYYMDSYRLSSVDIHRNTYMAALGMGEPGIVSFGMNYRQDIFTSGIKGSSYTLGYGIIFSPDLPFLQLSIAGLNLTRINGTSQFLPPRLIDGGISFLLNGIFTLSFDAVKDLDIRTKNNMDYHAGGEVLIENQIAIRGGYIWQNTANSKNYSLGIGWDIPRFSLDYSFIGDVGSAKNNTQIFGLTIYPF